MSKYKSIILKGFSPSYTESTAIKNRILWHLILDANNYSQLTFDYSTKKFNYVKCVGGTVTTLSSNVQTFSKNQVYNIMCGQTNVGMVLMLLKNNGTVEKYTNADVAYFTGLAQLYPLAKNTTGYESDAFAESFHLIDLQRIGKINGFSDAEADAILRGVLPNPLGIQNPELYEISKVTLHPNATRSNGIITHIASGTFEENYIDIQVLPNNVYEFKVNTTARSYYRHYYNNIALTTPQSVAYGNRIVSITTLSNCNKIRLYFDTGSTSGAYTFSDISLRRKD